MFNQLSLFFNRLIRQSKTERLKLCEKQNFLMAEDLVRVRAQYSGLLKMKSNGVLSEASVAVFERLNLLLKLRDPEVSLHSIRVARIAGLLAKESGMGDEYCMSLELAVSLHDIGIIALPADTPTHTHSILLGADFEKFKSHCVLGETILSSGDFLLDMAARLARSHHELFDGSGYPDGLSGQQIPFEARIVALADYIEGLLGGSHGNQPLDYESVYARLTQMDARYFDPEIARLVDLLSERICYICQCSD